MRVLFAFGLVLSRTEASAAIDRYALVTRHNISWSGDSREPLQVGNGEIAFGVDATGLQTFGPGSTLSHWGWHEMPPPTAKSVAEFRGQIFDVAGREIVYPLADPAEPELSKWLAANPHRFNLGKVGLWFRDAPRQPSTLADLQQRKQSLDLWSGLITSQFTFDGVPIRVETCAHPRLDGIAIKISSPLLTAGKLGIELAFPYAALDTPDAADWNRPDSHSTTTRVLTERQAAFSRRLDGTSYEVIFQADARVEISEVSPHRFHILPSNGSDVWEAVVIFSSTPVSDSLPNFEETRRASAANWGAFWQRGAAIDLEGSSDPRWRELERRIVLSQYLMAINAAGSLPPQESGLVNNSGWHGRFHWEMYWWHGAHHSVWGRQDLLDRSLGIYQRLLPQACTRAAAQRYAGARWPKCTGPDGREWPHPIHAWLLWQQPHPIFFAELEYRSRPTAATLGKWRQVVFATADFLASLPQRDATTGRLSLGPPLHVVSENTDPHATLNPTFELAYWRFGLRLAQQWRERLGLPREATWDAVLRNLAPLPNMEGTYLVHERTEDMWTRFNYEHPAMTGVFGWLPGDGSDSTTMKRTFEKVCRDWQFDRGWGWDFPMLAMCAARLGEPELAVDFLLYPSAQFQFGRSGLATGGPFPYMPSNGGLLYAAAMMAAGWDGAPRQPAPGFPADRWNVRAEGINRAP